MAIRHWSGRRLVGTWVAGMVGECVLIALPIAFLAVTVFGGASRDVFIGEGPYPERLAGRGERIARIAEVEARVAGIEARAAEAESRLAAIRAAEAAEARAAYRRSVSAERRAVELVPPPAAPAPTAIAFGRPIQEFSRAEMLQAAPWYAFPLAGAVALYVLAIPLGLLAITFVWMIARFTGYRPPPSAA